MTASLEIDMGACGCLASTGAGAGLPLPHGAIALKPAGEGGFRSQWKGLFSASAASDERMPSAQKSPFAKSDGETSSDDPAQTALAQKGGSQNVVAPAGTKPDFGVALNPEANGFSEIPQRSLSKAEPSSVFRKTSSPSHQKREAKGDSSRKTIVDAASQPFMGVPISVSVPVPVKLAASHSAPTFNFPRNLLGGSQNPPANVAGRLSAVDLPVVASRKTDRGLNDTAAEEGATASVAQSNFAVDRDAAKDELCNLSALVGEHLPMPSSSGVPGTGSQPKHPQSSTVTATAAVQERGQGAGISSGTQSDSTRQTALSTDAALNRRPEFQDASPSIRNKNSVEPGAQTAQGGGMVSATGAETAMLLHHSAAGVAFDHAVQQNQSGKDEAVNASREAFTALDGEPKAAGVTWIHAGSQHAEAGFQDPALGWVAVRAEGGAGGVHASILPSSADAASTLGGHLAGLHSHLAAEHIPVLSLNLNASAEGAGAGLGQSAAQQESRSSGQGGEREPASQSRANDRERMMREEISSVGLAEGIPAIRAGQGIYVSVMA